MVEVHKVDDYLAPKLSTTPVPQGACSSVVERSLSMREVLGSMPSSSIFFNSSSDQHCDVFEPKTRGQHLFPLLIGALDAIRRELEIDGSIKNVHDLFWDEDELSDLLDDTREYLEIEERANHLSGQVRFEGGARRVSSIPLRRAIAPHCLCPHRWPINHFVTARPSHDTTEAR